MKAGVHDAGSPPPPPGPLAPAARARFFHPGACQSAVTSAPGSGPPEPAGSADGVNLLNCCGADAWQSVFHFHLHLVPRHEGDAMSLVWPAKNPPRERLEAYAAQVRAGLNSA